MAGFEHLYRQGYGEAAVINLGGVVNQYAQQLQQAGLKRQKEREAYEKELSAINYDGVRQADVPAAQKRWLAVKDKYHELSKTDKDDAKLRIRSEISALKNDLTSFAGRSKEQKKIDFDIAKVPLTANKYEIVPDFGERLKTREQLSIEDPRFADYGMDKFQKVAKPYDTTKNLMDLANMASEEKEIPIIIGTGLDARRGYQRGKQIDEVAFKAGFLKNIAEDDHARDTYLNGLPETPENLQDAAQAAFDIVKDKFGLRTTEGNYIDGYGRSLSLIREGAAIRDSFEDKDDGDKEADLIYRQKLISRVFDGDPQALNEVKAYLPSGAEFRVITSNKTKDSKGGYRLAKLKIPAGEYNGNYLPAINEDISFSLGDPMNRLNAIINQYTGEKISPSKLNTVGGKPRGETYRDAPTQTRATPAKPAANQTPKTISFSVDGKQYNIPSDKQAAFLKQFPKAKRN